MRGKIFFCVCLLLCGALAVCAWMTHRMRALSDTFYLEMVPADPRALLMGDYMRLAYAFENKAERKDAKLCVVQETRERKEGERQEITQVGVLKLNAEGAACITVRYEHGRYRVPHQFFFQEGTGNKYANARYAAVRKIGKNTLSVVGLTDKNFNWMK